MTLPLTTRFVRIEAPDASSGDAYEAVTYSSVHDSVPAHIGPPTAENSGDRYQSTEAVLYVNDTVTVPMRGRVTDLTTGDVWAVQWTASTVGLGLDHRRVGLRRIEGEAP